MIEENELQKLYQYAIVLCNDPNDAYDILQASLESYLSVIYQKNRKIENPLAFIRTSIRNRIIDLYHSKKRWHSERYEEESVYDISPVDIEALTITKKEFELVWQELDQKDKDILYHWAVLGYSTDEACEILQISRGTFLSRMHRLKKKHIRKNNDKRETS